MSKLPLLAAVLGFIVFILIATTFPAKDKLFEILYPKPKTQATDIPKLPDVRFVSNELLIKVKKEAKAKVKAEDPSITGIPTLDNVLKEAKVKKFEPLIKESKHPDKNAEIFSWYKISLDEKEEIIKGTYDNQKKEFISDHPQGMFLLQTIQKIKALKEIESVGPNYIFQYAVIPNDPFFSLQWNLHKIDAPKAWDNSTGRDGVIIAILDSGVSNNHDDLNGKVVTRKTYFDSVTQGSEGDQDVVGHGTGMAGIASANTNNNFGIAGVGFNVKLMSVKVGDVNGVRLGFLMQGITWAVDNGASVINMSIELKIPDNIKEEVIRDVEQVVNDAWNRGAILVGAAGNDNSSTPTYPCSYANVICVASARPDGNKSDFSNYGSWVDVAAPGENIWTLFSRTDLPSISIPVSGTSAAAPHVAGLAALIKSSHPDWSNAQIREKLESSAEKIPGTGSLWQHGQVNACLALDGNNCTTYASYNIFDPGPSTPCDCTPPEPACGNTTYCTDSRGYTCSKSGPQCIGIATYMVRFFNKDCRTTYSGNDTIYLMSNVRDDGIDSHNPRFYPIPDGIANHSGVGYCEVRQPNHPAFDPGYAIFADGTYGGCPPENMDSNYGQGWSVPDPPTCSWQGCGNFPTCDVKGTDAAGNDVYINCNESSGQVVCNQIDPYACQEQGDQFCNCTLNSRFGGGNDVCVKEIRKPNDYPTCLAPWYGPPLAITKTNPTFIKQKTGEFPILRDAGMYFVASGPYGMKLKIHRICSDGDGQCNEFNSWVQNPSLYPERINSSNIEKDWNQVMRSDNPAIQPNYWGTPQERRINPNTFHLVYDVCVDSPSSQGLFADTTTPSVSITNPTNNEIVKGAVNITANASDNSGAVDRVEFLVNGNYLGTDLDAPYEIYWYTSDLPVGANYTVTAKAYDKSGNSNTSSVNVVTKDSKAPEVSIATPSNYQTVSGTININATASDNVGISKVEFLINSTIVSTDTTAPYEYLWNTTSISNGSYSLSAVAYDSEANAKISSAVAVTVSNIIPTPPPYSQSSYYTQASYYAQSSYYSQSSYYAQSSYQTPSPVPSPTPAFSTGNITGVITSSSGSKISGAYISTTISGAIKTFRSDTQGRYLIPRINPGNYTVRFQATGHNPKTLQINVTSGQTTVRNITLQKLPSPSP